MIKKVSLKNFESHEDSEIEFTDGLNLIIGQSNQGKSSIVRAIALVVANRFDKDCVRTGKDFCEVTVETEKGSVTAQRGESINRWIVKYSNGDTKEYKNLGTSVPPDAFEVLGIGERTHGDIKELPNIMFQLEKHYMLSEIDGKKATSNMIARMMDDAIGIGGMEDLIKDMATDFQTFKKDLNECISQISEKKSEIMEESIFKDKEDSVNQVKDMFKDVQEIESLLISSYDLSRKIKTIKEDIERTNIELSHLDFIRSSWNEFEDISNKYILISRAIATNDLIFQLDNVVSHINEIEEKYDHINETYRKMNDIHKVNSIYEKVVELSMFNNLDDIFEDFLCLNSCFNKILKAEEELQNARNTYRKKSKESSVLKYTIDKLKEDTRLLNDLKSELGECPLCGAKLVIEGENV